MLYELLDHILPNSDRTMHDILRLEYLSACQVMEDETYIMKILHFIPVSLFEPLLQSVIYKSYLKFITIDDVSTQNFRKHLDTKEIEFPETLRNLLLNWPHQVLVLRNQIPPLHPPVELFQNDDGSSASPKQAICQVEDMMKVFNNFCNRLVKFLTQAFVRCTPTNTQGFSCNIRSLDVSVVMSFSSHVKCYSRLDDILEGIRNSMVDTFGHKIEIFADANIMISSNMAQNKGFQLLSNLIEANLNPNFGISVYFKRINAYLYSSVTHSLLSDFFNALASGRCEYIALSGGLHGFDNVKDYVENLCTYLPKLVGVDLISDTNITNFDFLNPLEHLEQVGFFGHTHNSLINSICNMSKGLKELTLCNCNLQNRDIECLANSMHVDTLLELNLSGNTITNDSKAVGLIMLCQKLKNIKVLHVDYCSLYHSNRVLTPSCD